MPASDTSPMTDEALTQHRLKVLEEIGIGARETERRVDTLGLTMAQVEKTVTEIQAEAKTRDERISSSLARLHDRLDDVIRTDARESGRQEGRDEARSSTRKIVAWSVSTTLVACGLVLALLTLVLR